MILSEIKVTYYGPFAKETSFSLESDVTVLTGANDTGKSSALKLIGRICGIHNQEDSMEEDEVNADRHGDIRTTWQTDKEIKCEVRFLGTDFSKKHVIGGDIEAGGEIELSIVLAPSAKSVTVIKYRKNQKVDWMTQKIPIKSLPKTIHLPLADEIRTVIELDKPNNSEKRFLLTAFGSMFSYEKIKNLSDSIFYNQLSSAKGRFNSRLRSFLPPSMKLELELESFEERRKLSLQFRDQFSGHTPLGMRGMGIHRMIALMGALLSESWESGHFIILYDEPENSLHADAQHSIRRVLEALGEKPNIQVVYSTHSPSMINTMRPQSIRVFQRASIDDKATSIIIQRPTDANYLTVRSSLGITPADSLLFAPVTIVVEGPTEVIGLPLILGRLQEGNVTGFEDVKLCLSQAHFLDGCGDSFERLCKMAKSQGAKPIVFLDSDKRGSRTNKLVKDHAEIPLIFIDDQEQKEFEQIIPEDDFFNALYQVLSEYEDFEQGKMTAQAFHEWNDQSELHERMMFTKRVGRWLQDKFDGISYEKPLVMKKALQSVKLEKIKTKPLKELLREIRKLLKS